MSPETLPTFVVVGAQRAGTTYLAALLTRHPEVYMLPGEAHYFSRAGANGTPVDLDEYAALFAGAAGRRAVGEKTPNYLYFPWVPEMLAEHLPDVRIVVLLRDPVKRAYSHYWRTVRIGQEPFAFERALDEEPQRLTRTHMHRVRYSYQDRGRYVPQLERYLARFPREQIHVILSEDMKGRPRDTLAELGSFLGVTSLDAVPIPAEGVNHIALPRWLPAYRALSRVDLHRPAGPAAAAARALRRRIPERLRPYPAMRSSTRRRLASAFRRDVAALRDLLGRDLTEWTVR